MDILGRFTIKNLKLNKKRTIVTIIAIILATALIISVATALESFRQTMIYREKIITGNYHYSFIDVPSQDLKYFENNRLIENIYYIKSIGYTKYIGSKNNNKPYLKLLGLDENALKNAGIKLVDGRLPKNSSEIVISKKVIENSKLDYSIGQKLNLDISRRINVEKGTQIDDKYMSYLGNNEKLEKQFTKEYEIVGIVDITSEEIEFPVYSFYNVIITYLDNTDGNVNVYARLTKEGIKKQYKVVSELVNVDEKALSIVFDKSNSNGPVDSNFGYYNDIINENKKYDFNKNYGLFIYENYEMNNSTFSAIFGASSILIIIIMITSIFCIRNSFKISITEKRKQYGMLSSIGATPKQIKRNVLFESMILALIGIPIGILVGLMIVFIMLIVSNGFLSEFLNGIEFQFKTSWLAILVSIILSVITIYLSAISSARRASKISPIELIRSNKDINIKSKKLKNSKLTKKVFGIGGDIASKNLKRSRSKYRTTILSIIISVSIFIPLFTFIDYAMNLQQITQIDLSKKTNIDK